jgi:plasmid stability protein
LSQTRGALRLRDLAFAHPPRNRAAAGDRSAVDMRAACFYVMHMNTMIQIRNVPDALHRRLKSRAALAGMSLSDYLLREIREVAERPSIEELRARLERRSRISPSIAPADIIGAERDRK